jgi:hypothetical protein
MHPSRLRLGPSQSWPLTDASPGSARSPGLRVCRAAASRRWNTHTHAPFRTERQSFLRCWDTRLTISQAAVGPRRCPHAAVVDGRSAQLERVGGLRAALIGAKQNALPFARPAVRARQPSPRHGYLRSLEGPGQSALAVALPDADHRRRRDVKARLAPAIAGNGVRAQECRPKDG